MTRIIQLWREYEYEMLYDTFGKTNFVSLWLYLRLFSAVLERLKKAPLSRTLSAWDSPAVLSLEFMRRGPLAVTVFLIISSRSSLGSLFLP